MEGDPAETPTLFPATVGEKLRAAREAQGLDVVEIASRTRIPQRHLEAIERSDYTGLPSITYAIGFAKSYARAVGSDEVAIARELRVELGNNPERAAPTPSYETDDPARVPPRGLAWAGLIVAILALIGVGLWYGTGLFRGSVPPPETLVSSDAGSAGDPGNAVATVQPTAPTEGHVTLVALDSVWLRVSDGNGTRLFEKEMAPGERYEVPADADRPRVRTGRPDKVQVLINGSVVPPLGTGVTTVEVDVSAEALQNRGQPGATPVASAPAAGDARPRRAASRAVAPAPTAPVEATAANASAAP
ncbi:helix-turn-helix domain-containing protein [Sphingomonas hengshuiensis]|uniref:XRE family transcriptional regulator n=1 Tax=Sphingomonas hengshuiensis TaxID=1609977 RepID=A0A7U4LGI4_9SPHN|nr:helix-turn-helix domain-containing protein [Sphingomonas hengshuiensis]AJP73333.1 XRE family transcriptional regulator [Sphingomonas hengshuiensis]